MMRKIPMPAFAFLLIPLVFTIFQYRESAPTTYTATSDAQQENSSASVTLSDGMDREEIAQMVGAALDYDTQQIAQLRHTYRSMQWDAFNDPLASYFVAEHGLSESEREILLTHSTLFLDREADILEPLYVPGDYQFDGDETVVEVARMLLERVPTSTETFVSAHVETEAVEALLSYIQNETELLPDLVPLPPLDVAVVDEPHRRLLVFTTVYYNKGVGDLELRGDPETVGVPGDFDRTVFQRIYRTDGSYREREAGTFTWHQEHIHYHFSDFIEYRLDGIDNDEERVGDELLQKSTFCIRDVSRVHYEDRPATTSANFRICGRERQGVSVGWGDAYFNTYVDQNLDITELPSGTYRLTFLANPEDRFSEITKENNVASADIRYDRAAGTVEVVATDPRELPEFEHIHVEQDLN